MHVGDAVLLLGVIIIAALFAGLVFVGREYYRLAQQAADGSRFRELIEQQRLFQEIETGAERLWKHLHEDGEQLRRINRRIERLCPPAEDEAREHPA